MTLDGGSHRWLGYFCYKENYQGCTRNFLLRMIIHDSRKFVEEKCNINSAKNFPILMNINVIG